MSEIVSIMTRKDVMLPVLLLVPGQACAVLRVEGGAAHLKVFDATVGLKQSFRLILSRLTDIMYSKRKLLTLKPQSFAPRRSSNTLCYGR